MLAWLGVILASAGEPAVSPPEARGPDPRAVSESEQTQTAASRLKQEAVAVAVEVAEAYPADALSYALLGSAYHNTGRSEEAAKYLHKCLELNPKLGDAYEVLALIAYERGNPEETIRLCREALQLGPPNPDVLNRLGRAHLDLGRADEAVRVLQQAVDLPRPSSESAYLLGQAFLQSGDPARAKESFLKTLGMVPDHTQACFGLFTACTRLGQSEEANRAREQFQKLEATDRRALSDRNAEAESLSGLPLVRQTVARTLFGAAQIHRAHRQPAKAIDLLRRAALLDAENPNYRAALEAHFVQAQALEEGVAIFEQLARDQPANGLNAYFLGRLYGRLGRLEAAGRAYRQVQQWDPAWPQGYRALAELYLRADREPAEALKLARKAVELDPSGPHYFLLAQAQLKNRNRPAAIEAMKQAVILLPNETRYRDFLQQLQNAP